MIEEDEKQLFGIAGGAMGTAILDDMNFRVDFLNKVPVVGPTISEGDNLLGFVGGVYLANEFSKSLFDMGIDTTDSLDDWMIPFSASSFFAAFGSELTENMMGTGQMKSLSRKSMPTPTSMSRSTPRKVSTTAKKSTSSSEEVKERNKGTKVVGI